MLKAIIFDVDGTLANTERDGHRVAFNYAFSEFGLDWDWGVDLYGELLSVTGGKERIKYYLSEYNIKVADVNSADEINEFAATLHKLKTSHYLTLLKSGKIPLRSGVVDLINNARKAGITLAIATTTTPENVTVLLENQLGAESISWFSSIGAGDIVPLKKPSPDIYNYVLKELNLNADDCIAIEDSHNGWLSSQAANLTTVITTNAYTVDEDFTGADLVIDKMGDADNKFTVAQGDSLGHDTLTIELLQDLMSR